MTDLKYPLHFGSGASVLRARALHITGENERVLTAVASLASDRMEKFGPSCFNRMKVRMFEAEFRK